MDLIFDICLLAMRSVPRGMGDIVPTPTSMLSKFPSKFIEDVARETFFWIEE